MKLRLSSFDVRVHSWQTKSKMGHEFKRLKM